ncbi:MAG: hypothetical protein ACLR5O_00185 [Romboutsia timonensis]|uniref:hypothetical protein n=1 Tax=Romboutsia timonensis TaxID=1776391 RepID=UPI0039A2B8CE
MEERLKNNLFKFDSMGKIECNELINVECSNDKVIITHNNNLTKGLRFYETVNDVAVCEIIDKLVVEPNLISIFKDGVLSRSLNLNNMETLELDAIENTDDNSTEITCSYTLTKEAIEKAEEERETEPESEEIEVHINQILPNYMEHLNTFLNLQIVEYNRLLLSLLNPNLKVEGLLDSITILPQDVTIEDLNKEEK